MRFLYPVVFYCLLFSALPADASDSTLTLTGAIAYALEHGVSMRLAVNGQQTYAYDLLSSKYALLPSARASLSASGSAAAARQVSAGASAGGDYSFSPADYALCRSSGNRMKAAVSDLEQLRKDISVAVLIQFVKAVGAMKLIEVEQADIDYQTGKTDEIEARFQAGKVARSDLLQQRSNLAEARARYITAAQNFQREKLSLLDLLGLPLATGSYRLDTAHVARLLDRCSDLPAEHRFTDLPETDEIRAQRLKIAAEEAKLSAARLSYFPDLSFSAGWSADGLIYSSETGATGRGDAFTSAVRVGASLGIPLFDGRQRWLKVRNAENSVRNAGLTLEKMQQGRDLDIARAALDDAMAKEKISAGTIRCEAAGEALDAVEERYRAGASTLLDLNQVRATWISARSDLLQAQFDRIESTVALLNRTGHFERVTELLNESYGSGGAGETGNSR